MCRFTENKSEYHHLREPDSSEIFYQNPIQHPVQLNILTSFDFDDLFSRFYTLSGKGMFGLFVSASVWEVLQKLQISAANLTLGYSGRTKFAIVKNGKHSACTIVRAFQDSRSLYVIRYNQVQ